MLSLNKKLQFIIVGMTSSISVALMISIFSSRLSETWNPIKFLELYFYNLLFVPNLEADPRLVIIDSRDPFESRSRSDYAVIIRQLRQAGVKCVALNIRFLGSRGESQELIRSVAEWPHVILPMDFASVQRPPDREMMMAEPFAFPDSLCETFFPKIVATEGMDLPFDSLLFVTRHLGHINSINNEYYHFPPVMVFDGKCYASLPIEVVKTYIESAKISIDISSWLSHIPLDRDGQMLVNFIPLEKFGPLPYSWDDALRLLQIHPGLFRNTIVMVVNSGAAPLLNSPLGVYPDWALLASLTTQLLQHRHIEESVFFYPVFFSACMIVLSLIWLLFVAPRLNIRWRKTRLIFLAGNILLFVFILLMLRFEQQWLGIVTPLLAFNISLFVVRNRYYRLIGSSQLQYVDFGLAVLERRGQYYPIALYESPVGDEEAFVSFKSFLEDETFKSTMQRIRTLKGDNNDIKWIGEKLFNALFPGEVFSALSRSMDSITKNGGKILRLKLRVDAPELVDLPWELMYSKNLPPGFISLHKRMSLTRYIPLEQPIRKSPFRIPLRILIVISGPASLPPLDVTREKMLMKKALRPLIWGGDVRLKVCENAKLSMLVDELEHDPPDVLHYIGHGIFDEQKGKVFLAFEAETNDYDVIDADEFGKVLLDSTIKLVVLNSCESIASVQTNAFISIAQTLMRGRIPAVVAMQYAIRDDSASMFSKAFYSAFVKHFSVDEAVTEARRNILSRTGLYQQDWAAPVLFTRADEGMIFEIES